MNQAPLSEYIRAIGVTHGSESQLIERVHVDERFKGQPVWEGTVFVFSLKDHPTAHLCYAWEVDGRVTAVLHKPPVDSPVAAVRAAIVAGRK